MCCADFCTMKWCCWQLEIRCYLTTAVRILHECDIHLLSSLLVFSAHATLCWDFGPFTASRKSWRSFDVRFYFSILFQSFLDCDSHCLAYRMTYTYLFKWLQDKNYKCISLSTLINIVCLLPCSLHLESITSIYLNMSCLIKCLMTVK